MKNGTNSPSCSGFSISCKDCNLNHLCVPFTLDSAELSRLDQLIERKKPYQKNQILFSSSEAFKRLYAVRSGSFKSTLVDDNGVEQITSFHFPGDIIGFDALASKIHVTEAVALETSMVCEIPYTTIDELSANMPKLRTQITRLMSSEISNDQAMFMLLNKKTAEQRVCHFLHALSDRFKARNLSDTSFLLTMTRADIGNYLGLTVETVSRIFSRLQKLGYIKVDGKLITLLDLVQIKSLT